MNSIIDYMSDVTGSESPMQSFMSLVDSLMVVGHMGLIVMVAQHKKSCTDQDTRIGYGYAYRIRDTRIHRPSNRVSGNTAPTDAKHCR